jgi:hypothetical protein
MVVVRWSLRYGLSYRDVEELLADRNIEVDQPMEFRCSPAVRCVASRRGSPSPYQVLVPSHHRLRSDDPLPSAGFGQQWSQRRDSRPVRPALRWSPDLAMEHGEFVAEHQDLRVRRPGVRGQQSRPGQELPEDQRESSRVTTIIDHA